MSARKQPLCIVSFSAQGVRLSQTLARELAQETPPIGCALYTKCAAYEPEWEQQPPVRAVTQSISAWAGEQLAEGRALVFIGACGIAVRAIAPHIKDKLSDAPVLVLDENGQFVIPVLSGHMGGANALALRLAQCIHATPVLTTATDVHRVFAVDLFAKRNELAIGNRAGIARVSAKRLAGGTLSIAVPQAYLPYEGALPEGVALVDYPPDAPVDVLISDTADASQYEAKLWLLPRAYALGVGCRRGKSREELAAFIQEHLKQAGLSLAQVFAIASIDNKRDEAGLLAWSRQTGIPFETFSAKELGALEGAFGFSGSAFVKAQVGVDNVCERAAVRLCAPDAQLIYPKAARDGMTLALAKRSWRITFDEAEDCSCRDWTGKRSTDDRGGAGSA